MRIRIIETEEYPVLYLEPEYVESFPDQVYEVDQALIDEYRAADDAWRIVQGKLANVIRAAAQEGEGA
ncbi:hypothetical protein [Streptomyces atriruber]|uniref:hypothetical protein n=1 Tax=Streptomyces atriruber TaxID=545121 RepID=UPI0006E26921|nr:hypothetical protein [Streptomyces atriruber]